MFFQSPRRLSSSYNWRYTAKKLLAETERLEAEHRDSDLNEQQFTNSMVRRAARAIQRPITQVKSVSTIAIVMNVLGASLISGSGIFYSVATTAFHNVTGTTFSVAVTTASFVLGACLNLGSYILPKKTKISSNSNWQEI